mgnify:FL=1
MIDNHEFSPHDYLDQEYVQRCIESHNAIFTKAARK